MWLARPSYKIPDAPCSISLYAPASCSCDLSVATCSEAIREFSCAVRGAGEEGSPSASRTFSSCCAFTSSGEAAGVALLKMERPLFRSSPAGGSAWDILNAMGPARRA
jgi:hypothetical protein